MPSLSSIYIYECGGPPEYKLEEIIAYLKDKFPKTNIIRRKEFFSQLMSQESPFDIDELAKKITLSRVHNVNKELEEFTPLPLEINYEKKRLKGEKSLRGIVYDGFCFQNLCNQFIKPSENNLKTCHIVLTNQLLASFDSSDKRYHLRIGIYGAPNIISTPGFIEALAKPREYYLKSQMDGDELSLNKEFKDRIISYEDKRITELLKGYFLQAIFNHLQGYPFCEDKNCRLYNAHWQEDALSAQLGGSYDLCPQHSKAISA